MGSVLTHTKNILASYYVQWLSFHSPPHTMLSTHEFIVLSTLKTQSVCVFEELTSLIRELTQRINEVFVVLVKLYVRC